MLKKLLYSSLVILASATFNSAHALVITNPGLATSADSCYTGCTNNPSNRYDHTNILDGDWGQTGNTGFNAWNSGYYGGWVQVDFGKTYVLDRIELYAWYNTYDPFTISVSSTGSSWSSIAVGGYHYEPNLSRENVSATAAETDDWGAVYATSLNNLAANTQARYLRYSVNSGSPHWGYLFELVVEGHELNGTGSSGNGTGGSGGATGGTSNLVSEPGNFALVGLALGLMGVVARRRKQKLAA